MSKVTSVVAAALSLAVIGSAVQASTFTITPTIDTTTYYDPTTDAAVAYTPNPGHPVIAGVIFTFSISNLTAGEAGFGSGLFDINLTPGLSPAPAAVNGPDFTHDSGTGLDNTAQFKATSKASSPLQSVYTGGGDGDQGPSANDLKAIAFYMANPPYTGFSATNGPDPRLTLGQGSPAVIGEAYVLWNGTTPSVLSLSNVQYSTFAPGGTTFGTANNVVDPQTVVFAAPEPASLGVLALGGIALLNRRRKA